MRPYVSLHTHSEFSFLDGYSKTDSIAERVSSIGQTAVGLTDHQECSGHVDFEKSCKKLNIKPIFGMEGYLVDNVERVKAEKDNRNSHLCIFAENQQGLRNLWTVSSLAYLKGFYYRALADWDLLKEYKEGLIVTDGCGLADMSRHIVADDLDKAKALAEKYLSIFGSDNFFMELHTFQFINPSSDKHFRLNEEMAKMNQGKVAIARELGIPLIVVNDAHYSREEDWANHALVWAISTNQDQVESGRAASWIMSNDEIFYWMNKHGIDNNVTEEAINNTAWIGDRCNVEIERKPHVPMFTSSQEEDLKIFNNSVEKGLQERIIEKGIDPTQYIERIDKERELIVDRQLYGYFDIVADICLMAKNKNILVAPGRGSAAGSLTAYLMSINEIDPLPYGLYFERFLNTGREDFPDIDLDFPKSRRQEIKDYISQKYGEDKVCSIGNFARLGPLAAIADIARALNIPYADSRSIAKIIEKAKVADTEDVQLEWSEIVEEKKDELSPWIKQYPMLFEKMRDLVGLVRQSGTHASGVLISDRSLIGDLPLRLKAGKITTQFDMYTIAELGFIKFDILGIRHLDTLTEARKLALGGEDFDPNYYYNFREQFNDPKVWKMIADGKTTGIFQLETPAMTAVAKRLKPQNEKDVATLISLNRPGVVRAGMLDHYLLRREGKKSVATPHPLMADILHDTLGVVVYQEQVMEIAQKLANYSLVEADRIRWIMGKKHFELMQEKKPEFINRCIENPKFVELCTGDPSFQAELCWKQIEASGSYSFNKGHGAGYSLISSWGSYERCHRLLEYLVACLITDPDNINKYIRELRREGYKILPPDINLSGSRFTLADGAVRYGLEDLKHVGKAALADIIKNRPFDSFEDFVEKTDKRACGKRVVEILIKIGAFDAFDTRQSILREYYRMRKIDQPIPDFTNPDVIELIELEIVGNYITRDPLERFAPMIDNECIGDPEIVENASKGKTFFVGGVVSKVKEHQAKNGLMAFLELEWNEQTYPITVFADTYGDVRDLLVVGKPVIVDVERLARGCMMRQMIRLDQV